MTAPKGFHSATWADSMSDFVDWGLDRLFLKVEIDWWKPYPWGIDDTIPATKLPRGDCLYAIERDHHRFRNRENIVYIGITSNTRTRFLNHPKAFELRKMRGDTRISFGVPSFKEVRTYKKDARPALEELEHLLIWALDEHHDLLNERKIYTLPGMGSKSGRAWHVHNSGHRFAGRMPQEIVYPWMLVRPGRDRSIKI